MLNGINRRDVVGDVLTMFDYVEELERQNEQLKKERNAMPKPKGINFVDNVMLERGKEEIFRDVVRNWNKVQCDYNDETGNYTFTPFQRWLEHKLDLDDMPKTLSFEDFTTYFKQKLQELYLKEKKEALEKAKEDN